MCKSTEKFRNPNFYLNCDHDTSQRHSECFSSYASFSGFVLVNFQQFLHSVVFWFGEQLHQLLGITQRFRQLDIRLKRNGVLQFETLYRRSRHSTHRRKALSGQFPFQTTSPKVLCQSLHCYLQRIRIKCVSIIHNILCVFLNYCL